MRGNWPNRPNKEGKNKYQRSNPAIQTKQKQ
jgi:hypothetical protein